MDDKLFDADVKVNYFESERNKEEKIEKVFEFKSIKCELEVQARLIARKHTRDIVKLLGGVFIDCSVDVVEEIELNLYNVKINYQRGNGVSFNREFNNVQAVSKADAGAKIANTINAEEIALGNTVVEFSFEIEEVVEEEFDFDDDDEYDWDKYYDIVDNEED